MPGVTKPSGEQGAAGGPEEGEHFPKAEKEEGPQDAGRGSAPAAGLVSSSSSSSDDDFFTERPAQIMASIIQPPPFLENPGKPPVRWALWRRKFTTYLEAMGGEGFSPRRKLSMLEHCLGTAGLDMLDHLPPTPQVEGQVLDMYQIALGKLQRQFGERTNVLVERHHFITRAQRNGESAQDYLIALRTLASSCEYGNIAEDMIRDVFVGHTSNTRIQEKCLMQDRLDLDQLEKIVERLEHTTARLQTMKIKEEPKGGEVQTVRPKQRTFKQGNKTENPNTSKGKGKPRPCYRCGSTDHIASDDACPAWDVHCSFCKKRGHYAKVCQAAREQKKKSCNAIEEQEAEEQGEDMTCNTVTGSNDNQKPRFVLQVNTANTADTEEGPKCLMTINGMKIWILIDSGSPYTMLNEQTFKQIPNTKLFAPEINPTGYGGTNIGMVGRANVELKFDGRSTEARIHVTTKGKNLLGWSHQGALGMVLRPGTEKCVSTVQKCTTEQIVSEFPEVFSDKLGCLRDFTHKIRLKADATPVVHRVRDVAMRKKEGLKGELEKLLNLGVIEPIEASEWLFPIVLISKPDHTMRLCVDLTDLNKQIWVDRHPMPKISDLLNSIHGADRFSVIDLSAAYHQIPLHEGSRHYTSFITTEGAFRYKRMPFGLASASAVFQRAMSIILKGIPQTLCFQDDILLYGVSEDEHNAILRRVLERLRKYGLTVKRSKCQINVDAVQYLGHKVTSKGATPSPSLIRAIEEAPEPGDKDTLRSFLGLSEFYHRFVPNFSARADVLRELLRKNAEFSWSEDCRTAFQDIKAGIKKAISLAAFDAGCPTVITTDASIKGIGATMSQVQEGVEKVIGFASRTLTSPEKRYSTIEREALACWWAITHFRTYLWGAPFVLRTDHRPLVGLLTTKGSARATPRIENWYHRMLDYQFQIEYVPGVRNQQADCMSRLPMGENSAVQNIVPLQERDEEQQALKNLGMTAISEDEWISACECDDSFKCIADYCRKGWPKSSKSLNEDIKAYWSVKEELSAQGKVLMRADRLVVPEKLRARVVTLAHEGHKGISALKRTIRATFWWVGVDKDAERCVRECRACCLADKSEVVRKTPLVPIPVPSQVWDTLGMDIVGPISTLGDTPVYALTMIDYTSKWPEIQFTTKIDTSTVIDFLRGVFAREGAPKCLITDNGVQFTSLEMKEFLGSMGITHKCTSLYHPQCNGMVERLNRSLKDNLQLSIRSGENWKANVLSWMWGVRTSPNKIVGYSPFQMMRGRSERGALHPAWMSKDNRVEVDWGIVKEAFTANQAKYKKNFDERRAVVQPKEWATGDTIKIKAPWRVKKGESKYIGPFVIKEVGLKHVTTVEGKRWSMDVVVRDNSERAESRPGESAEDDEWETAENGEGKSEDSEAGATNSAESKESGGPPEEQPDIPPEEIQTQRRTSRLPTRFREYIMY